MCRRIGEYISLELFYFVNLTSRCSCIHSLPDVSFSSGQKWFVRTALFQVRSNVLCIATFVSVQCSTFCVCVFNYC